MYPYVRPTHSARPLAVSPQHPSGSRPDGVTSARQLTNPVSHQRGGPAMAQPSFAPVREVRRTSRTRAHAWSSHFPHPHWPTHSVPPSHCGGAAAALCAAPPLLFTDVGRGPRLCIPSPHAARSRRLPAMLFPASVASSVDRTSDERRSATILTAEMEHHEHVLRGLPCTSRAAHLPSKHPPASCRAPLPVARCWFCAVSFSLTQAPLLPCVPRGGEGQRAPVRSKSGFVLSTGVLPQACLASADGYACFPRP